VHACMYVKMNNDAWVQTIECVDKYGHSNDLSWNLLVMSFSSTHEFPPCSGASTNDLGLGTAFLRTVSLDVAVTCDKLSSGHNTSPAAFTSLVNLHFLRGFVSWAGMRAVGRRMESGKWVVNGESIITRVFLWLARPPHPTRRGTLYEHSQAGSYRSKSVSKCRGHIVGDFIGKPFHGWCPN
jgi:hypothetical protein